jgi:hypothetical protein
MSKISMENAVVKGHHVYLSGVNVGDIYDCFPEANNIHDPHATSVIKDDFQSVLRTLESLFTFFVSIHVRRHKM